MKDPRTHVIVDWKDVDKEDGMNDLLTSVSSGIMFSGVDRWQDELPNEAPHLP